MVAAESFGIRGLPEEVVVLDDDEFEVDWDLAVESMVTCDDEDDEEVPWRTWESDGCCKVDVLLMLAGVVVVVDDCGGFSIEGRPETPFCSDMPPGS